MGIVSVGLSCACGGLSVCLLHVFVRSGSRFVRSLFWSSPCVSLRKMGGTHVARAIGDAANADENIPVMEVIMWIGLLGLGLTFLCVIIYGVSKSCREGSCGDAVQSPPQA